MSTTQSRQLTTEQRDAIESRRQSVALSAGAGCGKTFVLTERFLAELQPGADDTPPPEKLHHLIAITFTDRAAREMRDRIRSTCYKRLQEAPPKQSRYWLQLLRSLDTARVSTIHAFCGALLRSHAVEAQLDPHFTVIEQTQSETLLAEIIEDVLREKLSDDADPLHKMVINLTVTFGLENLRSMTIELLDSGRDIDFDTWSSRTPREVVTIWESYRREIVLPALLEEFIRSAATKSLLDMASQLQNQPGKLGGRCAILVQLIPSLGASINPAVDLDAVIENARVQGAGSKSSWPDHVPYEPFKNAAKAVRDATDRIKEFTEFDSVAAETDAAAGLQLLSLAKQVFDRYEARKRELAWVDFNDLLVQAHKLLTDPAHAELQQRLASQVHLLLVDESQDTDPVQVELIQAMCGHHVGGGGDSKNGDNGRWKDDGKLFFVGDFKQSIYRFRGADPEVFRRMQESTPRQLQLTTNFRSQPAILDFVNALFCEALSGEMQYQPLRASRPQVTPTPAVEFLWATVEGMKKNQAGAREQACKQEAEFIARRIRGMLDAREKLVGESADKDSTAPSTSSTAAGWTIRPVELKDIAILFRALSDVQHYEEALRRYGIDYYLVGGSAFYAQQEIYDIVNLLRSLASPADTVSLAGALRSPIFALDDETLFWLAQHSQGLAAGLQAEKLPTELTAPQHRRAEFASRTLEHLRNCKDRLPIVGLINEALRLTGYDAVLLGEFMGERKLANLRKLMDQARSFDQSGALGLADFIVQLSEFVARQPREPLAATHPEGTNVVRLMTIHQAKGLEFPVVFVPDVNRVPRADDHSAVWHPKLGPLVKVPQNKKNEHTCGLDLYKTIVKADDRAERMRLFYVATTRAKDYLVLSSGLFPDDLESAKAPWLQLLSERFNLQTGEFIGLLPKEKEFTVPKIKVTMEPPNCGQPPQSQSNHNLDQLIGEAISLREQPRLNSAAGSSVGDKHLRLAELIEIDTSARRRFSVSRLSGHLQLAEDAAAPFVSGAEDESPTGIVVAAADLGTLVHQMLANVDFGSKVDVKALANRWHDAQKNSSDDLIGSAVKLVAQFLQSDRAAQLAAAKKIHRELEFLLAWPPDGNSVTDQPRRYLQGFIDCLYQDAMGLWHLLDYKTSQVSADSLQAAVSTYQMQLGVYALAVEKILGQAPVELAVHFLRPLLEHGFLWNDEMRNRTMEQVNKAMEIAVAGNGSR